MKYQHFEVTLRPKCTICEGKGGIRLLKYWRNEMKVTGNDKDDKDDRISES